MLKRKKYLFVFRKRLFVFISQVRKWLRLFRMVFISHADPILSIRFSYCIITVLFTRIPSPFICT